MNSFRIGFDLKLEIFFASKSDSLTEGVDTGG